MNVISLRRRRLRPTAVAAAVVLSIVVWAVSNYLPRQMSVPPAGASQAIGSQFTSVKYFAIPHEDDEGEASSVFTNDGTAAFPVFVYMTNGENTGICKNNVGYNTTNYYSGQTGQYSPPLSPAPNTYGAQGNNPPTFPRDPLVNATTGWSPLATATSDVNGAPLNGPCRANRLDSMINFWANAYSAPTSSPTPHVTTNQPPTGQVCFSPNTNIAYESSPGNSYSYTTGSAVSVVGGVDTPKDPCAYYWLTPTGDIFVFNLGDLNMGWYNSCPPSLPLSPATNGSLTSATGCSPNQSNTESYALSPADVVWAMEMLTQNGATLGVLPNLAASGVVGSAYYNAPSQSASGSSPTNTVQYAGYSGQQCALNGYFGYSGAPGSPNGYGHYNHYAVARALYNNTVIAGNYNFGRTCGGDPDTALGLGGPLSTYTAMFGIENSGASFMNAYGWDEERNINPDPSSWQTCQLGTQYEQLYSCAQAFWQKGGASTVSPYGANTGGMLP